MDQSICDKIVDNIERVNEIEPLSVSDLRLLSNFFHKRKHYMSVRKNGLRLVTELANDRLLVSFMEGTDTEIASQLIISLSLASSIKGLNHRELVPLLQKRSMKKSIYDNLGIEHCLQLLARGHSLEFK